MNNFYDTIIGRGDSYKYSHFAQYPKGTENNNSYIESRGIDTTVLPKDSEVIFFGLQMFIKRYLTKPITLTEVNKAEKMITAHGLPFNRSAWMDIIDRYQGKLPIVIEALPEGTPISPGNAMVQVRATDPAFAWLASFVETAILRSVWYPSTVATLSRECKKIIKKYLDKTTDDEIIPGVLPFRLHDFGARGVSSGESAEIGGLAHLVNFMGTDTVEALFVAEEFYGSEGPVGFSIPASEHSTMTSWGLENESAAYENMMEVYGKDGALISIVSDSYDIFNAVENIYGGELRDKILNGDFTLVVRPDSGNPIKTPARVIELLWEKFGGTVNSKGYKVLHKNVRVIQGDGINLESLENILILVTGMGFSAENLAFGMGGGLLQSVNRDTLKFAMKTSAVQINNEWKDVWKQPVNEPFKKSKKGIQAVIKQSGRFKTIPFSSLGRDKNYLKKIWKNGSFTGKEETFEEIRKRAELK